MTTVQVSPEKLRSASVKTADVADRLNEVINTLSAALASRGNCWGNDSIGNQFANGNNGYLETKNNMITGTGQFKDTFNSYAKGQSDSANSLEGSDHFNADVYIACTQ
jgi:hypothetical protein